MEKTLKVTNVLSDPTRYHIYQHLVSTQQEVTVAEVAEKFDIHQNVARLHLSKLEDIRLVISFTKKTGKGGRPARVYTLSDELIELSFPFRDYRTLARIAIESMASLGQAGQHALYETGKKYGMQIFKEVQQTTPHLVVQEKIELLEDAGKMLGLYATFDYNEGDRTITFEINNCPFKEIAETNKDIVCSMHGSFLKGMFAALFADMELIEEKNMFAHDCSKCSYLVNLATVQ